MKIVIFGLSISSSWSNGHATLWRGLCRHLVRRGHDIVFFERDTKYYAEHRDLLTMAGVEIVLYASWDDILPRAAAHAAEADAAVVTSFCPDGAAAGALIAAADRPTRLFYDLDTPVTLAAVNAGRPVPYIDAGGLGAYDLVLSFTGGPALQELRTSLGARRVATLYGSVDPDVHRPAAPLDPYRADLSYLGTYAPDRQAALEALFLAPARRHPARRFVLGGANYPPDFPWAQNIYFVRHLAPEQHAAFFSSCRLTLNVTRAAMAANGHCPSGRLFEAAACGAAIVSDRWPGLEEFFEPGLEVLLARDEGDVGDALELDNRELRRIGEAARERVLREHTAARRAEQLERLLADPGAAEAGVVAPAPAAAASELP